MLCPLLNKECVSEQCAWWFKVWEPTNKCLIPVIAERMLMIHSDMTKETIDIYNELVNIENKLG